MPGEATPHTSAKLNVIEDCWISIPGGGGRINLRAMPTITDAKKAQYNEEAVIGRATPLTTYSHSHSRNINFDIPLIATSEATLDENIRTLRAIESAVYPRGPTGPVPYTPPPVCRLKCGQMLSKNKYLCVLLDSYSVKFDPSVPSHPTKLIPYKFTVSTSWRVVYRSDCLPGQSRIFKVGV